MNIYVTTCDKYLPSLKGFAYLFNKYWYHEQPVTILGFSPPNFPLPPNFYFQSLGTDSDYPVDKWSDALLKFIHLPTTPKEFVLFFEDYWIKSVVNIHMVVRLQDYMHGRGDVLKVDLAGDRAGSENTLDLHRLTDIELVESNPESQYHMSLYVGIWDRDLLKQVLIPNETPWQVELDGTNRLRYKPDLHVIGTRNMPVPIMLANRGGDPTTYLIDELNEEDQAEIKRIYEW